jgi:hypothetical protein
MRHFDIVDIITEGIHSDERSNLEIDEYNYMFHNILNVHNTISKNDNMINNGLDRVYNVTFPAYDLYSLRRSHSRLMIYIP